MTKKTLVSSCKRSTNTKKSAKTTKATKVAKSTKTTKPTKAPKKVSSVDELKSVKAKGIKKPAIDESKTRQKVTISDKTVSKFMTQSDKVADGISRFNSSNNKKNTEFLKNNINRTIDLLNSILSEMK